VDAAYHLHHSQMLQPYRVSMLGCLGDANRWETTGQIAIKENRATLGKSTFG